MNMPNLSFLDKDQNGQTTFCQDLPFLKFEKSLWNCLAEICKYHVYIRQIVYLLFKYLSIYHIDVQELLVYWIGHLAVTLATWVQFLVTAVNF